MPAATPSDQDGQLSASQERLWFRYWVLALIGFFVVAGGGVLALQWRAKKAQVTRDRQLMDPAAPDPGVTAAAASLSQRATTVETGFYVERIPEVSTREASWTVIFDVWFRWHGEDLDPIRHLVVMDGSIESREQLADHTSLAGMHYQRYRVAAKITKPFEVSQVPLDNHLLILAIEDGELIREKLLFVPDVENTSVSSRAKIPGYRIAGWQLIEKAHSYKTTRGDPRLELGAKSTHSQCRLGIFIERSNWGLYWKMFQALHIAVVIAFLACFIKPTDVDPRFGLGIGALFAAVANSYLVNSLVPDTGELALADMVNGLGILTILVTLIESTISLYLYDQCEEQELSRRLDSISFKILVIGFAVANVAILAASML